MTDKQLQDDLQSLTAFAATSRGKAIALPARKVRAPIPGAVGVGKKTADQQLPATGGGIASPLTEPNQAARTYYVGKYWKSTDGLIWFAAPSKFVFQDANSATVEIIPDDPP